jgi:hypothetical protein
MRDRSRMAVTWREKMFGDISMILSFAGTGFTVARFTKQMTGDIYAHTRSGVHVIERGSDERERLSVAEHSHS